MKAPFKRVFNYFNRPKDKQSEESRDKLYCVLAGFINPAKIHTEYKVLYGFSIKEGVGRYIVGCYLVAFDYSEGWILVALFNINTLQPVECMVFQPEGRQKVNLSPNGTFTIADRSLKSPIEMVLPQETSRKAESQLMLPIEQREGLLALRVLVKDKYSNKKRLRDCKLNCVKG